MYNVVIIGAGQLGSRHLQAMKKVKTPSNIFVIDPDLKSLDIAKQRYNEFDAGEYENCLKYSQNYKDLPESIDLAIVASGSKPRKEIVENLLKYSNVKYMILEKLLFSKVEHLNTIERLLEQRSVKAWVNCPMRMTLVWTEFKNVATGGPIKFKITGTNYGLMTNIIHYLDYIVYLTGSDDFTLDLDGVDETLYESKRLGYKELMGTIVAHFSDGSIGIFECTQGDEITAEAELSYGDSIVQLDLIKEKGKRKTASTSIFESFDFHVPYQSELTTNFVNSIFATGDCELPTYTVSSKTHKLIMEPILEFLKTNTDYKEDNFPFT